MHNGTALPIERSTGIYIAVITLPKSQQLPSAHDACKVLSNNCGSVRIQSRVRHEIKRTSRNGEEIIVFVQPNRNAMRRHPNKAMLTRRSPLHICGNSSAPPPRMARTNETTSLFRVGVVTLLFPLQSYNPLDHRALSNRTVVLAYICGTVGSKKNNIFGIKEIRNTLRIPAHSF